MHARHMRSFLGVTGRIPILPPLQKAAGEYEAAGPGVGSSHTNILPPRQNSRTDPANTLKGLVHGINCSLVCFLEIILKL